MEFYHYLLVFGAGLIAGFINTVAGGGSLLTLPVLIFMGLPPAMANGTNRVGIFLQNAFAVSGFKSKGVSAFPFAIWLSISALIGALIGAKFAVDIKGELFNRILAVVMIAVVLITIFDPLKKKGIAAEILTPKRNALTVCLFFFVGLYGGFIQAGIGFVIMMVLTSVNHLSLVKTNSIKVFVVFVYTAFALGVFIYEGVVDWELGLTLAAGTSIGGWTASRWSVKKGDKWIRYFLIVTVLGMSIKLFFFSDNKDVPDIKGIWEVAYRMKSDLSIEFDSENVLIEFEGDSISLVHIGDERTGVYDTVWIEKFYYQYLDSILSFEKNDDHIQMMLKTVSEDSLVISFTDFDRDLILKRPIMHNSRVKKKDLIGKAFSGGYSHVMDFVNDSVFLWGNTYVETHWTISSYKEFDFLVSPGYRLSNYYTISKTVKDSIIMSTNFTKPVIRNLRLIKALRQKKDFIGKWIETSRSPNYPKSFQFDTLQSLAIRMDSICSKRFNKEKNYFYELSSDGRAIYFPDQLSYNSGYVRSLSSWVILECDEDVLKMEVISIGDTIRIHYRRVR